MASDGRVRFTTDGNFEFKESSDSSGSASGSSTVADTPVTIETEGFDISGPTIEIGDFEIRKDDLILAVIAVEGLRRLAS